MPSAPRILSISSDYSVFQTRNQVLTAAGFEVVGCFRGEGALQIFAQDSFVGVVIGGSVPKETRHVLVQEFKRLRPSVLVVIVERPGESMDTDGADMVVESTDGPQRLIDLLSTLVSSATGIPKKV